MKKRNSQTISHPDSEVPDYSLPKFDAAVAKGMLRHGETVIRRGRPPSDDKKIATSIRLDADVVEHFKAGGPGWQSRINETLRRAIKRRAAAS